VLCNSIEILGATIDEAFMKKGRIFGCRLPKKHFPKRLFPKKTISQNGENDFSPNYDFLPKMNFLQKNSFIPKSGT
jgi:hypothetical protein